MKSSVNIILVPLFVGTLLHVVVATHSILAGTFREQRIVLNAIRFLGNELQVIHDLQPTLSRCGIGLSQRNLYSEAEALKSFAGDVAIAILRAQVLDILLRHLVSNVIRLPNRERDNRQRGIFRCAGCELTAVRNE